MNLEPIYIRISKADTVRHAYLGLEGTIVVFEQREDVMNSEFQIPVELVTISEGRRFIGCSATRSNRNTSPGTLPPPH